MKKKLITTLLCGILGNFGVHRFYLGYYVSGIIWLITGGFFGFGVIYDLYQIVDNKVVDSNGQPLEDDCPEWLPILFLALSVLGMIITIFSVILNGVVANFHMPIPIMIG